VLLTLESGGVRAEIGTVAATLRSLSVGGVDLTEPSSDEDLPPFCSGIVLAPWPNRVADARWSLDGETRQLDITEPARGNALHGLLQFTDYQVDAQTDEMVELSAYIPPQHGWPYPLQTGVRYELQPDGIRVTHSVHNRAATRAPWAVGTHPFLRVGDVPVEQLTLQTVAGTHIPVDDRLNPTGPPVAVDGPTDLREPRRVGDLRLDTAFGDLSPVNAADGVGDVAWLEAPDGSRTTLWQDLDWRYLQVFTTPEFPGPDGPATAVAVEPMTAPPDALNSGEGLVWLEPDERWSGSWGLRYSGPAGS
jgi:aldose 1-epimerase